MSATTGAPPIDLGGGAVRTDRVLADGRAIAYYDHGPGRPREAVDRRVLDDAPTITELRRDPLLDEWIVVAGHRQARTFHPPPSECPLCPTHGDQLTEVPEADYEVVVFQNRFPSMTQAAAKHGISVPDTRHGFGRCEVVCFTSDHASALSSLTRDRLRLVREAWIDRAAPHARTAPAPHFPLDKGGGRAAGPPGDLRDGDREIPPHACGVSAPFHKGVPPSPRTPAACRPPFTRG